MRRKRLRHAAQNLGQMFCGWQVTSAMERPEAPTTLGAIRAHRSWLVGYRGFAGTPLRAPWGRLGEASETCGFPVVPSPRRGSAARFMASVGLVFVIYWFAIQTSMYAAARIVNPTERS